MGTSVACYNRARRPGAPGNTHAKRKKENVIKAYRPSLHITGGSPFFIFAALIMFGVPRRLMRSVPHAPVFFVAKFSKRSGELKKLSI